MVKKAISQNNSRRIMAIIAVSFIFSLGCSAGKMLVQQPEATPTLWKTPRPTYTYTPDYTATFTPSPTPTNTPTITSTPLPTPTPADTQEEIAGAEAPPPTPAPPPPPPAEPTATPSPIPPTSTPVPKFTFQVVPFSHDTGSSGETRFTGWIRLDRAPGIFKTLAGFQMKVVAPDGTTHLSEPSGIGHADSTVAGTGDNHFMNTKLEISPYQPGTYRVSLVEGTQQVSPEVQVSLSANPLQYVHFDFLRIESN